MATTTTKPKPKLSAAAQRKLAYKKNPPSGKYVGKESNKGLLPPGYKGPEKGRYYGPEKNKGRNPSYKPPKAAAPAAPAAPAVAPAANAPAAPGQQSAYNPNAGVSNSSGTISLQTTHDLNMEEVDAQDARDQEVLAANQDEKTAELQYNDVDGIETNALNEKRRSDRGNLNSGLAYRGLTTGSTAIQKSTAMNNANLSTQNQIAAQRKLAKENADNRRTAAENNLTARKKNITLARESYTIGESGSSPTEGSQAEDSGINPTSTPAAPAAAPKPPKAPAAAKYKGKYQGPDRFKGDAKKLAAWRKAGRPKK